MMASLVTKNVPPSSAWPTLNVISVPAGRTSEIVPELHRLSVKTAFPGDDELNVVLGPSKTSGPTPALVGHCPGRELQPPPHPVPSMTSAPSISDGRVPLVALLAVPQLLPLKVLP